MIVTTKNSLLRGFVFFVTLLFLLFPGKAFHGAESKSFKIVVYDLEPTQQIDLNDPIARRQSWDEAHLVTALQGLVNRRGPRLYLYFVSQNGIQVDRFWLKTFRNAFPDGKPGRLQKSSVRQIKSLKTLLKIFRDDYKGLVVYDERVPATSNLASTIAGAENLLPIRFDHDPASLFVWLTTDPDGPRLTVKKKLLAEDGGPMFTGTGSIPGTSLPSTGSAKADAYRWLTELYVKTGKTSSTHGGYYMDAWWLNHPNSVQNHLLVNHDYFIARKGFFFDLSPWNDETPIDDPNQPIGTDAAAFCDLLRVVNERNNSQKMIHVGGFTPWDLKYTDANASKGKHGAVDTEWRHAEILSNFNAFMDADALGYGAMANASFFAHFPLRKEYPFPKPTVEDLKKRGLLGEDGRPIDKTFVSLYVGDYDSAAWVYQNLPIFWNDPNRGSVPIGWAFNPNLADRFAAGFDYFRQTATPNDFFIAGDSGAGYVNPMGLIPPRRFSDLPSGLDIWKEHCKRYYNQWNITATGFLIDGFAPATNEMMKKAYATFSPDGIVLQHSQPGGVTDGMPWIGMKWDLPKTGDSEQAASIVLKNVKTDNGPQFLIYRTILWTPTEIKNLYDRLKADPTLGDRIEIVDPYAFFLLFLSLHENSTSPSSAQ